MQILFLMGSQSIQSNKENYPIYLTEINQKLLIERQIANCQQLSPQKIIFCINKKDVENYALDSILKELAPESEIITIGNQTKGAICTALLSAKYIDNDEELIIMAIDDFIEEENKAILQYFRDRDSDGGVVYFHSVHPRYSFVKLDDDVVIQAAEKKPISKHALASFYYFKHGSDFVACAKDVIRKDNPIKNAFYISQTINEMILKQKNIVAYHVESEHFHPIKTEIQLTQYLVELKEQKESK